MNKMKGFMRNAWGQRAIILLVIFVIMLIGEPRFFTGKNAASILLAVSLYGIMACGMLFAVLIGGLDLSVGSTGAVAGCFLAFTWVNSGYTTSGLIRGFILAAASGIVIGLINGILVAYVKLPAFVITLAAKYFWYGFAVWYSQGSFIYPARQMDKVDVFYALGNARFLGLTMPVWAFVIIAAISTYLLSKRTFGRRLYAVGGSPNAAELVGINTRRFTVMAYVISALFAAIAGMIIVSLNMVAGCNTASGYEGNVLMAMVVGGVNLAGGEGGVSDAVFGAIFVGIINNVLILLGIPSDYNTFVQGVVILAAICLKIETARRAAGILSPRQLKKMSAKAQAAREKE